MNNIAYEDNKFFHIIILPTEQCNFRCRYCYEDFEKGKMSNQTLRKVLLFIQNLTNNYNMINIGFFGGEPLLAYDIIVKILEYMSRLANMKNIYYEANISTNGFLLSKDKFEKLYSLNLKRYQITLDGYRDFHDKVRVTIGSTPTFDIIWKNLESISQIDGDFTIFLRLHVHKNNIESIKKLIDIIAEKFSKDNRFWYTIRPISRFGGRNDRNIEIPSKDIVEEILEYAKLKGLKNITNLTYNTGWVLDPEEIQYNVGLLSSLRSGNMPMCYASSPHSIVIRSDGSLAKCTVWFNDERNKLGYIGDNGELQINYDKLLYWTRGIIFGNLNDMICPANKIFEEYERRLSKNDSN